MKRIWIYGVVAAAMALSLARGQEPEPVDSLRKAAAVDFLAKPAVYGLVLSQVLQEAVDAEEITANMAWAIKSDCDTKLLASGAATDDRALAKTYYAYLGTLVDERAIRAHRRAAKRVRELRLREAMAQVQNNDSFTTSVYSGVQ